MSGPVGKGQNIIVNSNFSQKKDQVLLNQSRISENAVRPEIKFDNDVNTILDSMLEKNEIKFDSTPIVKNKISVEIDEFEVFAAAQVDDTTDGTEVIGEPDTKPEFKEIKGEKNKLDSQLITEALNNAHKERTFLKGIGRIFAGIGKFFTDIWVKITGGSKASEYIEIKTEKEGNQTIKSKEIYQEKMIKNVSYYIDNDVKEGEDEDQYEYNYYEKNLQVEGEQ